MEKSSHFIENNEPVTLEEFRKLVKGHERLIEALGRL